MKKTVKKLCLVLLMLCFCMRLETQAEAAQGESLTFFQEGDVVGFIGDSITHAVYTPVNYVEALYQYYLSRFPERQVEFRNLGAGGYKVRDVLNIYHRDPAFHGINKAVIMLGTNEAILETPTEEYLGNMAELIDQLKKDGLSGEDILILSPPICDETCSFNFDGNGNKHWTYESRVLEYTHALETKTREWGVHYLDIHTPMAELTEEMQRESNKNSLTIDCIHPSTTAQMLIASYILQAQGADGETLSGIFVPREGEAETLRDETSDFYRGEKGVCFTWKLNTLPVADTEELQAFREFSESGSALLKEPFQVEGLSEEISYRVLMGETELGSYTGTQLSEGIDLSTLETHPLQMSVQQMEARNREWHQAVWEYRNIWIEVMMQRADPSQEEVRAEYEKWRSRDEELRREMYAVAQDLAGDSYRAIVIEEGASVEELEQEAEQARKEAEERARKEAEEQAKREAEEKARKESEEQAARTARRLKWILAGLAALLVIVVLFLAALWTRKTNRKRRRKRRKNPKSGEGHGKSNKNIKNKTYRR